MDDDEQHKKKEIEEKEEEIGDEWRNKKGRAIKEGRLTIQERRRGNKYNARRST